MGTPHARLLCALCVLCASITASAQAATRIKDLCEIQGARENGLRGIGLVVGLAGTGDQAEAAKLAQEEVLNRLTLEVTELNDLESDNIAVVIVTSTMPAFVKEGTTLDVTVHSYFDAESLEGGTLIETLLYGIDNEVYAVAQGPISVGGFNVDAGGASARKNHVTVGRIPAGAYVEREIPSTITDGQRFMLLLKRPDFGTARNIKNAINAQLGFEVASAFGAGTVSVIIPPDDRRDLVEFIARVQDIPVTSDSQTARVVINERTGTIVVGGNVLIRPCQVAHGGLTITVARTPIIAQPLPFSRGQTVGEELVDLNVESSEAFLMPIEGASAAEVAEGLNRLRVTPRDMIAIFQALREAGVMDAELEIM